MVSRQRRMGRRPRDSAAGGWSIEAYGRCSMFDVEPLKLRIVEICRRTKVSRLDLIGPAGKGDCPRESEVDVLVCFQRDGGEIFNRFFDLKEGLEQVFGRAVDVTVEESITSPVVWESVESSRRNVYAV